jgi:hypothetical protein
MDLKTLYDTPPWEWPEGADKMLLGILRDDRTDQSDCLLAAELAGDSTVVNDELVDAAWPHIAGLVTSAETEKSLLLAAIEASVSVRAKEAREILGRLTDADDQDIVEAVYEAMSMAGEFWGEGDDENEDDEFLH